MPIPPGWSAHKLAEFLAVVSSFTTEADAALGAVERVAESLDAEVAAIVSRGAVVAAIGYPEGATPLAELDAVARGHSRELAVPGDGLCPVAVVPLEHPPDARLVVARSGTDPLSADEAGLLQGMARVTSMTLRMLRLLDGERALRQESERQSAENAQLLATLTEHQKQLQRLADEQAALRRVATLVARQPAAEQVLATVTEEVGRLLRVGITQMLFYENDGTATAVAGWIGEGVRGQQIPVGTRLTVEDDLLGSVLRGRGATRMDSRSLTHGGPVAEHVRRCGLRSATASPIVVEGQLWGVMIAGWASPEPPSDAELRIAEFTQLVATAISNAEARRDLERHAREQAARRRIATLVADGVPPADVFAAVTDEVAELFGVPFVGLCRLESNQTATTIAGAAGNPTSVGRSWCFAPDDHSVLASVLRTGQPARVDDYTEVSGKNAEVARALGIGSAVGVPVVVDGRVWGALTMAVAKDQLLPVNAVERLKGFTELVATAISNTHARAEVMRLAEEQAALRRVATLVAKGVPPSDIFTSVADEIARISHVDNGFVLRFEPDGTATVVANSGRADIRLPVGSNWPLDGDSVTARVFQKGRPARIDGYRDATGPLASTLPDTEFSSVGAPIVIDDRLWGVAAATSATRPGARPTDAETRPGGLPADAEERITGFADLIATAISNADTRAQLTASRARVVAAADDARRRLERDLHDGIQQRLVSLALALRSVESLLPPERPELQGEISQAVDGLTGVLDELRELSRGIHPAILSEGGLGFALKVLARRSAVPAMLSVRTGGRLPERVEVPAYYIVSEALTNAAKHAKASVVHVDIDRTDGFVRIAVRDDGVGGADLRQGSGLIGLVDRVEAAGGKLTITSPPGSGTSLLATLPLDLS